MFRTVERLEVHMILNFLRRMFCAISNSTYISLFGFKIFFAQFSTTTQFSKLIQILIMGKVTPTRRKAVLELAFHVTVFMNNEHIVQEEAPDRVRSYWDIRRHIQCKFVSCQANEVLCGEDLYRGFLVVFYDDDGIEIDRCNVNTPYAWTPRTLLVFLMNDVQIREHKVISVVTQNEGNRYNMHPVSDLNNIIGSYSVMPTEASLELEEDSVYNVHVKGGGVL